MAAIARTLITKASLSAIISCRSPIYSTSLISSSARLLLRNVSSTPAPPPPPPGLKRISISGITPHEEICPKAFRKLVLPPLKEIFAGIYGYDHEYWKFQMFHEDVMHLNRDQIIDKYIKMVASVVGSEEEAKKVMYSASTKYLYFFVCRVSLELAVKIIESTDVLDAEPLSDSDLRRTDFLETAEPFINGEAAAYDPIYHEAYLKEIGLLGASSCGTVAAPRRSGVKKKKSNKDAERAPRVRKYDRIIGNDPLTCPCSCNGETKFMATKTHEGRWTIIRKKG